MAKLSSNSDFPLKISLVSAIFFVFTQGMLMFTWHGHGPLGLNKGEKTVHLTITMWTNVSITCSLSDSVGSFYLFSELRNCCQKMNFHCMVQHGLTQLDSLLLQSTILKHFFSLQTEPPKCGNSLSWLSKRHGKLLWPHLHRYTNTMCSLARTFHRKSNRETSSCQFINAL